MEPLSLLIISLTWLSATELDIGLPFANVEELRLESTCHFNIQNNVLFAVLLSYIYKRTFSLPLYHQAGTKQWVVVLTPSTKLSSMLQKWWYLRCWFSQSNLLRMGGLWMIWSTPQLLQRSYHLIKKIEQKWFHLLALILAHTSSEYLVMDVAINEQAVC